MVLTLRNRLPFTRVHSHAVAQKSSGAFFRVMARERCWKWLTRYRVALRAFQAVRATDVMVNPVALTCLPLCTVVSENNYIVRRTALFGRRKAVLQTMVYRYEFFLALIQARRRAISVIFRMLLISISVNSIPPHAGE